MFEFLVENGASLTYFNRQGESVLSGLDYNISTDLVFNSLIRLRLTLLKLMSKRPQITRVFSKLSTGVLREVIEYI